MVRIKSILASGLVVLAAGCSHVGQDEFNTTVADLRSELAAQNSAIEQNQQAIFELSEMSEQMQADIASLHDEFKVSVEQMQDAIRFATPVHFDYDRDNVRDEDVPLLERFAAVINEYYPHSLVTVEGFADPAGSAAYNKQLSGRRAENVARFLQEEAGLTTATLRTLGYGEDRQVIEGARGPDAGLENRRVAFVVERAEASEAAAERVATGL